MLYLSELNEAQKKAVTTTLGPISVLAGAGAGKTKVLTTRIYHLIRQGVPGNEILAVTFTNKAAREMRERVRVLLKDEVGAGLPFIATFHGLGRELLESYGSVMGIPRFFSIYDRDDSEKAISLALKKLDVDTKELSPRAVLFRISKAKNEGLTVTQYGEQRGRSSFAGRITAEVWRMYESHLKKEKALDFDDLVTLPVRLLKEHPEVRAQAQQRWSYVHIDEYQDTSALQGELATLLSEKHRNLFVVGDIDQTIYTWRGATIENLLAFDTEHPSAATIVLEHNYRSTKTIVEAANAVIEQNKNRKEKKSVTDNARGEKIVVRVALNAEDEARFVAEEIKRLVRGGARPEDIAVLFRTNAQSRALEEALLRSGVPYRLLGTRFFSRKEIKDALAWVRLALDPAREGDKIRAASSPPRGIGKVLLGKLAAGKRGELTAREEKKVADFELLLATLQKESEALLPSEFVRMVIEKSGLEKDLAEGGDEAQDRLENVKELATLASRHDSTRGKEGIAAFLAEAALASDQDELDRNEEKKGVTLMTVHAAKGLEFEIVFVTGMEEGLFPHEGQGDEERDEEEERRLFYVAMTRAKSRLILTLVRVRRIYGTDYLTEPSSFLHDIGGQHLLYDESSGEEIIYA